MGDLEHSESKDKQKEKYLRILNSGSVREKALMLGNHLADVKDGEKEYLLPEEIRTLANSFKSDKEIDTYNQYRKIFQDIDSFLITINQFKLSYSLELSELDKLIILKKGYYDLEQATNILLKLIPDINTKKQAISKIDDSYTNPFNYKPHLITCLIGEADDDDEKGNLLKEGTLKIFSNLDEKIKAQLNRVKAEQIRLKTAIQAVKDFMKKKKFTIRSFTKFLQEIEAWAKADKSKLLALKVNFIISEPTDINIKEPKYELAELDIKQYQHFRECYLYG